MKKFIKVNTVFAITTGVIVLVLLASVAIMSKQVKDSSLDYCREVALEAQNIVSQDGVITDAAITAMSGRNTHFNHAITKCLEVTK